MKTKRSVEYRIAQDWLTMEFMEHEFLKIDKWENSKIKYFLNLVFYEFLREAHLEIIKTYDLPEINYKVLSKCVVRRVKLYLEFRGVL